jgi:hypothetical protein
MTITRSHWTPSIRQKACECLFAVSKDFPDLRKEIRAGIVNLRPREDGTHKLRLPAQEAYELFFADPLPSPADRKRVQDLDIHKFYAMLRHWAPMWFQGKNKECVEIHVHPDGLTKKEARELCHLLAVPGDPLGDVHNWRSFEDACDNHPKRARISELVEKSRLSPGTLTRYLPTLGTGLYWGVLDIRDRMAKRTAAERKLCAAQWRGDRPWLLKKPGELAVPVRPNVRVPRESEALRYVFWKEPWPILDLFSFQTDAYELSTARGHRALGEKGFYSTVVIYRPEEGRAEGSDTSANKVMWYIVTCKQLGLVGTPEPCYHGSTPTLTQKELAKALKEDPDGPEKHREDFPHWCVPFSAARLMQC